MMFFSLKNITQLNTIQLYSFLTLKFDKTYIIFNKIYQHGITLDNNIKFNKTHYFHKIHKLEMIQKKIRNNI